MRRGRWERGRFSIFWFILQKVALARAVIRWSQGLHLVSPMDERISAGHLNHLSAIPGASVRSSAKWFLTKVPRTYVRQKIIFSINGASNTTNFVWLTNDIIKTQMAFGRKKSFPLLIYKFRCNNAINCKKKTRFSR